jgi:hypothetical protein
MNALPAFGLFAVTAMLVCYALEDRSYWFILAFAAACALGSAYGFLQGAWPFGVVEAFGRSLPRGDGYFGCYNQTDPEPRPGRHCRIKRAPRPWRR